MLIFVDCEAGPAVGHGDLREFGAVEYTTLATFHGVLRYGPPPSSPFPRGVLMNIVGDAVPQHTTAEGSPSEVFNSFGHWLKYFPGQPVFVSDNPAYDWQWINFYFWQVLGRNPFGHSARRISDFYAGLMGDFSKTQDWKRWRVTPHDHNPVHDALGNAEAFRKIMALAGLTRSWWRTHSPRH